MYIVHWILRASTMDMDEKCSSDIDVFLNCSLNKLLHDQVKNNQHYKCTVMQFTKYFD